MLKSVSYTHLDVYKRQFLTRKIAGALAQSSKAFSNSSKNLQIDHENHKSNEYFDIVVCGGGMVGNAMTAVLGQDNLFKDLKIALIDTDPEKSDYFSPKIHHNRVSALSSTTIDFLKSINSWDFIQKHRFGEIHNMHVWDGSSDAFISFKKEDGSNLAWIVENELVVSSLAKNLVNLKNVKVFYSNKVEDFKQNDQTVDIELKNNSKITAKLLIGSDGGNSFIRKKANINVVGWNYDQVAIVATMKLSSKTQNFTAWQRFLSTGPIALLPLNDEYSSLVWSVKKNMAKTLLELSDEEFVHRVNQAFILEDFKNDLGSGIENLVQNGIDWLRSVIPNGNQYLTDPETSVRILPPQTISSELRACFPLSFMHSNNYVSKRVALIGDSIHKVHPLAGQGVNLGFGDVICLKECLKDNLLSGNEIGSLHFLKDYESRRQSQALPKIIGIDALNKLYTDYGYADFLIKTPLVAARTIGLTLSNRVIPIKNFFIKQAMK